MDWTEWLGFITGLICVYMVVKQNPLNWPIGMLNAIFFLVLFWRAGLYADSMLQIFYFIIGAFGWWNWKFGGTNHGELTATKSTLKQLAGYSLAIIIVTFILYQILIRFTPSTVPFWDALTTSLSLTAQYMLTRKRLENWYVWILADIIYIALYIHKDLILTAILYAVFMGLCVMGVVTWLKSMKGRPEHQDAVSV